MFKKAITLALWTSLPAFAQEPVVPSGQKLELFQEGFLQESDEARVYYVSFIAPAIEKKGAVGYDVAHKDIESLCTDFALANAKTPVDGGLPASEVIIRLMDIPVKYGETNPDAQQYMGFYDVTEGTCEWH